MHLDLGGEAQGGKRIEGWIPVRFIFPGHHRRYPEGAIKWLDCSGVSFMDSFFLQSIDKLRSTAHPRREALTRMQAIRRLPSDGQHFLPAGLIFQISRCGSTAVANALRAYSGAQVVSEAWPVTQLIWEEVLSQHKSPRCALDYPPLDLLNRTAWALAACRTGRPEKLILKLTSSSLLGLIALRSLWPQAPTILIIRQPLEVLCANMPHHQALNRGNLSREQILLNVQKDRFSRSQTLPKEDYLARVLRNYLEIAYKNIDLFDLVIDHSQISVESLKAVTRIFGLGSVSNSDLKSLLRWDAKSPLPKHYEDDSLLKRESASVAARRAVDRWTIGRYNMLLDISRRKKKLVEVGEQSV